MCVVGSGSGGGVALVQFRWSGAPWADILRLFIDTVPVPHMRKINRNSTSLQVHVVCVHTLNIIYKNFF